MSKLTQLRRRPYLWVALALGAAACALLAWGAPDRAIADLVRELDPRPLAILAQGAQLGHASWSLIPAGALLLALLAVRGFISRPRAREACDWIAGLLTFAFLAIALSGLSVDLVKWVVGRTRPNLVASGIPYGFDPLQFDAAYQSFPSGHANTLIVLGLLGGILLPRLAVPLLTLAAVLALGRVTATAHYLSDLLGGAALAVATTFWLRERFAARGWVFVFEESRVRLDRRGRLLARWLARRRRGRRRPGGRTTALGAPARHP
jgi:membrane-associated phospholipid phosphatase